MSVHKDDSTNTWRVVYRYTDYTGKNKQSQKRGFATKREALAWERENASKLETKLDMTFASFVEIYTEDMKKRVKENTWKTKEHIIETKILPHFKKRKIGEILPKDILAWQNKMLSSEDKNGKPFSPSYLKTIHNQLSAIFNHACKFYGLTSNPAAKVGNMGKATSKEMEIWTQDEYRKFAEQTMDKPQFFYAFEMLYWCGIREGELLALTPADFDFKRQTVTINKSYQRFDRRDVITEPKTSQLGLTQLPIFLTEWNNTPSQQDLLNDTCFKSCYIVKNILENFDRLDSFAYWSLTDWMGEAPLPKELFFGGLGLFTVSGIPKASYYALCLLRQLGNTRIGQGDGWFATQQGNKIAVLLYNYRHFSHLYAQGERFDMTFTDRYTPFDPVQNMDVHLTLKDVQNGSYLVRETILNRKSGSAFDKWVEMGALEPDTEQELKTLEALSTPLCTKYVADAKKKTLEIDAILDMLEVRLIIIEPITP